MTKIRGNQRVTNANPEDKFDALSKYGRDLTEQARKGNLGYRVNVPANDEMATLVRGFNEMMHGLEDNSRELESRRRFTEAHEYCHFLVDRQPLEGEICTIYRRREKFEMRANAFAASVRLAPSARRKWRRNQRASAKCAIG